MKKRERGDGEGKQNGIYHRHDTLPVKLKPRPGGDRLGLVSDRQYPVVGILSHSPPTP